MCEEAFNDNQFFFFVILVETTIGHYHMTSRLGVK